jgi:hypothetical protein
MGNVRLHRAAEAYLALGLAPLPIRGKVPMVEWKRWQTERPGREEMDEWFLAMSPTQLSLVTGELYGFWVMDCDGPSAAEWAERNAPETTRAARTRKGIHRYYGWPDEGPVRTLADAVPGLEGTGGQIDARGQGGTIVAPPSPWSRGKGEYEWLSEGDWASLPKWYPSWQGPGGLPLAARKAPRPPRGGPSGEAAAVRKGNLRGADLRGVSVCTEAPAPEGRRNASLASVAGKWISEGSTEEEALGKALQWNRRNRKQLGLKEVEDTVASVVRTHGRNHGTAPAAAATVEEAAAMAEEGPEDPEEADPYGGQAVPERFSRPGGLLGDIVEYASRSRTVDIPLFSMGAGLCMIGTLLGGRVTTETGLRTNLYVIGLSPSGSGKDSALAATARILDAAGVRAQNLGPTELASGPALMRHVADHPVRLFLLDEIGDLVGTVNSGRKDTAKAELITNFKKLFAPKGHVGKAYANSEHDFNVSWHHVSLFGTGVPAAFWKSLTVDDVMGGFLSRSIVMSLNLDPAEAREDVCEDVPEPLAEAVRRLDGGKGLPRGQRAYETKGNLTDEPAPVKAGKTPEARAMFREWSLGWLKRQAECKNDPNGTDLIYSRVSELAHKVALIHAASRTRDTPRSVEPEDVDFAMALMDWNTPRYVGMIRDFVAYNPNDYFRRRVLRLARARQARGLTQTDVYRLAEDCSCMQVDDAIRLMVLRKDLIKTTARNAEGYVYLSPAGAAAARRR